MKKCLICGKVISKKAKTYRVKDFVLLMEGESHIKCGDDKIKNNSSCYAFMDTEEGVSDEKNEILQRKNEIL